MACWEAGSDSCSLCGDRTGADTDDTLTTHVGTLERQRSDAIVIPRGRSQRAESLAPPRVQRQDRKEKYGDLRRTGVPHFRVFVKLFTK